MLNSTSRRLLIRITAARGVDLVLAPFPRESQPPMRKPAGRITSSSLASRPRFARTLRRVAVRIAWQPCERRIARTTPWLHKKESKKTARLQVLEMGGLLQLLVVAGIVTIAGPFWYQLSLK